MHSVILAGGVGERFWPLSRRSRPKQLLDLTGKGAMIELAVERARTVSERDEVFIVTLGSQRGALLDVIGDAVPAENVIGEPVGRNTAPSVGLAAIVLHGLAGDVPFLVLPADHLVDAGERFQEAVRSAAEYVRDHDSLATFGITPTRPETGYGYIRAGERLAGDGADVMRADAFLEKPSAEKAVSFLEDGSFLWNSGMFCWRTSQILSALNDYATDIYDVVSRLDGLVGTSRFDAVLNSAYPDAPSRSIDYAVMEQADNVVVVRGDFYWNDVGGWESIRDVFPSDDAGNVTVGDHVFVNSGSNTVFSPKRIVGVVGVDNVVIVDSGDAILVCSRDKVQDVRALVDSLKKKGDDSLL